MSTNKTLREISRYADTLGLTTELVSKNRHAKVKVVAPDGRTGQLVVAVSGSSKHETHLRAQLKRFASGGTL